MVHRGPVADRGWQRPYCGCSPHGARFILFSYLYSKSNYLWSVVCIGFAALTTRELVALLLSAGAEQGMSCLQFESLVHVYGFWNVVFCLYLPCLLVFFYFILESQPSAKQEVAIEDFYRPVTSNTALFGAWRVAVSVVQPQPSSRVVELKFAP